MAKDIEHFFMYSLYFYMKGNVGLSGKLLLMDTGLHVSFGDDDSVLNCNSSCTTCEYIKNH
jgi:hypothetical protein